MSYADQLVFVLMSALVDQHHPALKLSRKYLNDYRIRITNNCITGSSLIYQLARLTKTLQNKPKI